MTQPYIKNKIIYLIVGAILLVGLFGSVLVWADGPESPGAPDAIRFYTMEDQNQQRHANMAGTQSAFTKAGSASDTGIIPAFVSTQESEITLKESPLSSIDPDPTLPPIHIPPPPGFDGLTTQSSNISAQFNPGTCSPPSGGAALMPWPDEAKTAFNYALSIWSSLLDINQPIVVDACLWSGWTTASFAEGGVNGWIWSDGSWGMANTYYPRPLVNQLRNNDANGAAAESLVNIRANLFGGAGGDFGGWYFGTDGNPTGGVYDFATVMLHEVGHSLGYGGSMTVDGSGYGYLLNYPDPFIYDRFVADGNGQPLLNYPNYSIPLGNALTGQVGGGIAFIGTNATAANGGASPHLYAPSSWSEGRSYDHLDDTFQNTPNALFTKSLGPDTAIHNPGPIALGMMVDMGWTTLTPSASLTLHKSAPSAVESGGALTYTLQVTNTGFVAATNIVITDTAPAGVTLNPASLSSDASYSGTGPGSLITWTTGQTLAANQTLTRTFVVTVDNSLSNGVAIANTGYVSASNTVNSQASNTVETTVVAPLALNKTAITVIAKVGIDFVYRLVATNTGTVPLTSIVLTDAVPANTTLLTAYLSGDATYSGTGPGSVITWTTLTDLNPDESLNRNLPLLVDSDLPQGSSIQNTAYVTADSLPGSITSNSVTNPVYGVYLSMTKTVAVDVVKPGNVLTYTLTLRNLGDYYSLTKAQITDTVPANTTLNPASLSGDATYSGAGPGSVITWTVASLEMGNPMIRTMAVSVDSGAGHNTTILNTAYGYGEFVNPANGNDTELDSITATVDALPPIFSGLITPTAGITVSGKQVNFGWNTASDWTGSPDGFYRLTITTSNDSLALQRADSVTTAQTSYTVTNLAAGVYTWTVTAEDKAGNNTIAGPETFRVAGGDSVYLPIVIKNTP